MLNYNNIYIKCSSNGLQNNITIFCCCCPYANIDRELLTVEHVCERFHHYVFGNIFTIDSNHRPLEMITLETTKVLFRIQNYYCGRTH